MRYETSARVESGAFLATCGFVLGLGGACGGEGEVAIDAGDIDGGDLDGEDLRDSTYDGPDDFDRSVCDGDLDEVDPAGIWHVRLTPEEGEDFVRRRPAWIRPQGDVIRLDGDGENLEARVAGKSWETARDVGNDVFLRHSFQIDPYTQPVRALNACGTNEDGDLVGEYADCHFPFGDSVACSEGTLRAIRVGPRSEAPAAGLEELADYAGPDAEHRDPEAVAATSVRVRDDVAYVLGGGGDLWMVDVSEPSAPAELGRLQPGDDGDSFVDLELVAGGDGDVYAALGSAIADVSEPAHAEIVAQISAGGRSGAEAVAAAGDRLYLASGSPGGETRLSVSVYDVSDPRAPTRLGEDDDAGADLASQPPPPARNRVYDLHVEDERAYVSFGMLGFRVLDVSDPETIETIDVFDDRPRYSRAGAPLTAGDRDVIVHVDEKVGGKIQILDADESSSQYLEPMGSYELRPEVAPGDFALAEERAYVAHHQDGLRVVDLGDPEQPEEIAHYNAWPGYREPGAGQDFADGAMGVDVDPERDLVFVADSYLGLVVLAQE